MDNFKDRILEREYTLNLCLTKFIGSDIIEIEDSDGMPIKGVFIPIDLNYLFIPNNGSAWTSLNLKRDKVIRPPKTHFITPNWPREHNDRLRRLGYLDKLVFFGEAYTLNPNSDPKLNTKVEHER